MNLNCPALVVTLDQLHPVTPFHQPQTMHPEVIDMVRRRYERGEEAAPTTFMMIWPNDNKLGMCALNWNEPAEKAQQVAMLGQLIRANDVAHYTVIAECFAVTRRVHDASRDPSPSQSPDRREMVIVATIARDGWRRIHAFPIRPDRQLAEPEDISDQHFGGDMVDLFAEPGRMQ